MSFVHVYIPHSNIRNFILAYTCSLKSLWKETVISDCKKEDAEILLPGNVGHYANEAVLSGTIWTLSYMLNCLGKPPSSAHPCTVGKCLTGTRATSTSQTGGP